jgi:hypothetical protein
VINGIAYDVAMVTSPTTLMLMQNPGVQNPAVAYSATIPTGDIFADAQAYVLPTVNLAWRKLQKKLDYSSHPRMRNEVDIFNLPVAGSQDTATQQWISWSQFFDGVNLLTPSTTPAGPVLPQDFISPLRLYERASVPSGVNPNRFLPMHPADNGLPSCAKGTRNYLFDWREDALYFVGAILALDLRIQYQSFLPDIALAAGGFGSTVIPVMRCAEALANYSAAIFVTPRGGALLAPGFEMAGDAAADALTNRQAKLSQRGSFRRKAVYNSSGQYRR